jgi:hypothetical protein
MTIPDIENCSPAQLAELKQKLQEIADGLAVPVDTD